MTRRSAEARASSSAAAAESIRALATVTLDARALDELGPATIERLADLVAARLAERRAAGEEPLLAVREAARVAGAHPDTVRRAIRSGSLTAAGYVGNRPRLRRCDVEDWVAGGRTAASVVTAISSQRRITAGTGGRRQVLGDALRSRRAAS